MTRPQLYSYRLYPFHFTTDADTGAPQAKPQAEWRRWTFVQECPGFSTPQDRG
ncbi:MAG: hypothetical protein ACLRWQ_21320 [Flavonifractor plautii]